MKIHVITDSAADMSSREGVTVLPMTITFGDTQYLDGINLTHREFYDKLVESDLLPVTSQLTPYDFEQAIERLLPENDAVVIITISGKLSGTFNSANVAAKEYPGRVFVVDSLNVSLAQKALVEYAVRVASTDITPEDMVNKILDARNRLRIVALLDTLEYLQKGGRISKAAAFAGGLLSIKPVVGVEDGIVAMFGKARGSKQANNLLNQQISLYGSIDFSMPLYLGYTGFDDTLLQKYIRDSSALWSDHMDSLPVCSIGATIGTHVGPGAIAFAWFSEK